MAGNRYSPTPALPALPARSKDRCARNGGSPFALFRDAQRTAEYIARIHPADGKAYSRFMELLNALFASSISNTRT